MGQRGLVLVVGGTGTGKSTTLAAMIDYRAQNEGGHILTIEDPIEFVHGHSQALERIINFFPESAHAQILMDISMHLNAIVSQRLCLGVDRKRVAVVELMFNTGHVSELIRLGKLDEIKEAMSRSEGSVHKTFDHALFELYEQEQISETEALRQADSRNNLALQIRSAASHSGGVFQLEKELSFNQQAPFEHYRAFTLKPLQVSEKRRADTDEVIRHALTAGLEQKGLKHSPENPDIEVQ